jgi:hypothetical protein
MDSMAALFAGAAMAILAGCGPGEGPKPAAVAHKEAAAGSLTIETVLIAPSQPTKNTGLKAQVRLSGPPGSDGRDLKYQWLKNGDPIARETNPALSSSVFRKGDEIAVRVSLGGGGDTKESAVVRVINSAPRITMAWITPVRATREQELEAKAEAVDADEDKIQFRYQWSRNGAEIPGATGSRLLLAELKKKDAVAVRVTPFDGEAEGLPYSSHAVEVRNAPPVVASTPPGTIKGGTYTYQVAIKDADKDPISFALAKAPAGMTIDKSGLITWPISEGAAGVHSVEVVATDPDGAKATQAFTVTVSVSEKQP